MDQPESLCFWASWGAYKHGKISERIKLQYDLAHVFTSTRHPEEVPIKASEVNDWSERDIVSAAVLNCLVQELKPPPGSSKSSLHFIIII